MFQTLNTLSWYGFKSDGMGKEDTHQRGDMVLKADRMLSVGHSVKGDEGMIGMMRAKYILVWVMMVPIT